MSDIDLYKSFQEWCDNNPSFDLDARLHTHGGPIEHDGYISHEKTRVAFAAYRAGLQYFKVQTEPYAWSLEGVDADGIPRRYELRDAGTAERHREQNMAGGGWLECNLIPLYAA